MVRYLFDPIRKVARPASGRCAAFWERRQVMAGFGNYERTIDALDGWLSGHDYVCGARFTMVDVYVGSQVDWGLQFKSMPALASFEAYAGRLRGREGYRAAKAIDNKLIEEMQR